MTDNEQEKRYCGQCRWNAELFPHNFSTELECFCAASDISEARRLAKVVIYPPDTLMGEVPTETFNQGRFVRCSTANPRGDCSNFNNLNPQLWQSISVWYKPWTWGTGKWKAVDKKD